MLLRPSWCGGGQRLISSRHDSSASQHSYIMSEPVCCACAEFVVEPPTAEITTGWQATQLEQLPGLAAAAAGGVWEGHGRRSGHQVCWRVEGAELELSENCMLPGAALVGGELRLRFAANLLPPVGLIEAKQRAVPAPLGQARVRPPPAAGASSRTK